MRVRFAPGAPPVSYTHLGEMPYGAGMIAARKWGALETVDPRPWAVGSIKETFEKYTHIGNLLPAMGYSPKQIRELEETANNVPCDLVIVATPIDLRRVMKIDKPSMRAVSYTHLDVYKRQESCMQS